MPSNVSTLAQKVIDYIGFSDAAMSKAASVITEQAAQQEKIARLIPEAVKACVENERIELHQKEAMAAALKDPVRAVELVIKLASHRNAAELSRIGAPLTQKAASYDPNTSVTSSYVGARDGKLKASDIKLFTGLGLNPPTS
jgi:hypothetical protein